MMENAKPALNEEELRAGRARLAAQLDLALAAAAELGKLVATTFPDAASQVDRQFAPSLANLSVDAKLALGQDMVGQLHRIAFEINPSSTLDMLERDLPHDAESATAAGAAIAAAKATPDRLS